MKIFLVLSAAPYDEGEAIEVVSSVVVRTMASQGHELDVQVLIRESANEKLLARSQYAQNELGKIPGINFLPVLYLGDMQPGQPKWLLALGALSAIVRSCWPFTSFINSYFFPGMIARKELASRVETSAPDIVLSIWSWEALAATYDIKDVPKFVYYGNPNHKPPESQLRFPDLFDIPTKGLKNRVRFWLYRLFNRARELQHLKMMARCEVTANNSIVDAKYYTDKGHPNSIYLQNMWPEAARGPIFGGRPPSDDTVRIAASVGNLGATGNTFGLHYLGAKLAPATERLMADRQIVFDVYGGGKARSLVAAALQRDSIRLRGWVDDLDEELYNSHAFLVLTNVDGFIVGNTRILLAWSLGCCVIAHSASALAMPEIEHMKNALLADTPEGLAELIARVVDDDNLRERIGRGGYETYQKYYLPEAVVSQMLDAMGNCVQRYNDAG